MLQTALDTTKELHNEMHGTDDEEVDKFLEKSPEKFKEILKNSDMYLEITGQNPVGQTCMKTGDVEVF